MTPSWARFRRQPFRLEFYRASSSGRRAHHWYVKAIPATGEAVSSSPSAFTIDAPGDWPAWAIGPFERYGENPIVKPQGTGWEQVNTYNPGVLFDNGKFRMLYRAQGQVKGATGIKPDRISREGYAESPDGVTFTRNPRSDHRRHRAV